MFLNPFTGDLIFGGYTSSRPFIGYFMDAAGTGSAMFTVLDLTFMQANNHIYALMRSLSTANPTYNLITSIEKSEGKPIQTWYFAGILINTITMKSQILVSETNQRIIVLLQTVQKQYIVILNSGLTSIVSQYSPSQNLQFRCISNIRASDQKFVAGG
eukprot:403374059